MGLPVYLSQGLISIYGTGSAWGMFGFTQPDFTGQQPASNIAFGTIDQTNYGSASLAVGDNVMYDTRDVIAPVFYNNRQFNILPGGKVIAVEYVYNIMPPIPPP